jgi:hypothetical protein
MRHASLTTTERFYLRQQAHDIGDRLAERLGTPVPKSASKADVPRYTSAREELEGPAAD